MSTLPDRDAKTPTSPAIVAVDRLNDGLVIKFEDGQCAFYASSILFSILDRTQHLEEDESEF